tara:strand:+ start:1322 stop:1657 length:336 start_codon:yes stop_codon:yes gene_type:complete
MNVRFWEWQNGGRVKLKLSPGETVNHFSSENHDEGYSSTLQSWTYDEEEETVIYTRDEDGRDCDGRLSNSQTYTCPIDRLEHAQACDGHWIPEWDRVSSRQRDWSAGAMGY